MDHAQTEQLEEQPPERDYDDAPHMHAGTVAPKLSLRAHDGGNLALSHADARAVVADDPRALVADVRRALSGAWPLPAAAPDDAAGERRLSAARETLGAAGDAASRREARAWANPYEPLGRGTFVCRSALKLCALDAAYDLVKDGGDVVDVCAAPGGCAEYAAFRGAARVVATSLAGANGDGEGAAWRVGDLGGRVELVLGPDGKGDVYDAATRDAVVAAATRARRPTLVVADGGFDAADHAPDQDAAAGRLCRCEFAVAVAALAVGGNVVLKLFLPLRSTSTAALVHAAGRLFATVALAKPVTSRATSGEVYLIALGLRPVDDATRRAVADALTAEPAAPVSSDPPAASWTVVAAFLDAARRRLVESQADACETMLRRAAGLPCLRPPPCDVRAFEARWHLPGGALGGKRPRRPFVVGVVGPSGVGKSTLAAALAGRLGAAHVKEDPAFFLKSCPKSYEYRDPVSECPEHIDWEKTAARADELLAGARLAVVEHYLLLAPGRERFLFDRCDCVLFLDPGVDADGAAARATCRERRAGRTAGRPDAELAHLRAYYDAHVWPAFERYTLAPFRALPGECKATLDARRPPAAVLADALAAVAAFRAR